jgi:hypothetical protein
VDAERRYFGALFLAINHQSSVHLKASVGMGKATLVQEGPTSNLLRKMALDEEVCEILICDLAELADIWCWEATLYAISYLL